MDEISHLKERLLARRKEWPRLQQESGVSIHTFRKLAFGYIENPRTKTYHALRNTLDQWDSQ